MDFALRTLSTAALCTAVSATTALANGVLPTPAAAVAVSTQAASDWTGAYVGATLSYGAFEGRFCDEGAPGYSCSQGVTAVTAVPEPSGALYGIAAGYDWQSGNIVYGIMGDLLFGDLSSNVTGTPFACGVADCQIDVNSIAMVRARLGYAATDQLMPYATLGVAATDLTVIGAGPIVDDTSINFVVGLGTEYRLSETLSLGLDYTHFVERAEQLAVGIDPASDIAITQITGNLLRLSLSYRF